MKKIIYIILAAFTTLSLQNIYASDQNSCLLTATLLEDPVYQLLFSEPSSDLSEEELKKFKFSTLFTTVKVLVTKSKQTKRQHDDCKLPNSQPYQLTIVLEGTDASRLKNAKRGDVIKLLRIRSNHLELIGTKEYQLKNAKNVDDVQ